jgi:hypothetical protein
MWERRELQVPAEHLTDEQIASAIRYLDPDRDRKRSDLDAGTVLVICFSLLILLTGSLPSSAFTCGHPDDDGIPIAYRTVVPSGKALDRARELAELYLKVPEVTRRNTRVHFIQPLKERIVREVGYGHCSKERLRPTS